MSRPFVPQALAATLAAALAAAAPAVAQPPEGMVTVPVQRLAAAPNVDGDVADWTKGNWVRVKVQPADDKVEAKAVGDVDVELAAAVAGDRFFVAARWPDAAPDAEFRPWKWNGKAYKRSDERDDMFAVRFHLDGDYDRCMITENTYRVDVWLWAAGRTNASGIADDMLHLITTGLQDDAAEYKTAAGNTVYIKKARDAGKPSWENTRAPKEQGEPILAGVAAGTPEGSAADVAAKGRWNAGQWSVEMSRKLETGQPDDVIFRLGGKLTGAIAVFNKSQSENKSVSGMLVFDFSKAK